MAGMLAGCSAKEGSDKPPSQVAVKVNKGEVTVHQVNSLLARSGNIPPDQLDRARSAVVERLVDQELLLQQAKAAKLDRDPNVLQMLEFSRSEILARAYSEKVMANAVQPTEAEINKFYDDNPELFSKRRIYDLREVNVQVPPDRLEEVRKQLESSGGNLQQLMSWFSEQKMPVAENAAIRPAEQIPLEMLKNLAKLHAGQATVARTTAGIALIFVANVRDDPVDLAKAKPVIQNFLLNQSRAESIKSEIKRLRDPASAAIEYVGEFKPPVAEPPVSATGQGSVVSPNAAPEGSTQSVLGGADKPE
jgi:EpsD family peptidyl-prolyl cis-trans isomerase